VQIIEAEQRRDGAVAVLRESSGKCEGLKKECEGTLAFFLVSLLLPFYNSILILHDLFLLL
jgi:dolichol kinase